MGTLSKTLAGCGGYIAGCKELVDYLRLTVGVFVFSVGMPPVIAATAQKALEILHREPERVARLQHNAAYFCSTREGPRARSRNRGGHGGVPDHGRGFAAGGGAVAAAAGARRSTSCRSPIRRCRRSRRGCASSSPPCIREPQIETAIDVTAEELANVRERAAEFDLTRHG